MNNQRNLSVFRRLLVGFFAPVLLACTVLPPNHALPNAKRPVVSGVPLLATAAVDDDTVSIPSELADLLRFLDRNGDGLIAPYEGAEAMLLLTEEADSNGDEAVDYRELRDFLKEENQEEHLEREQVFDELDTNQDGKLTRTEIPEEFKGILEHADVDGDDQISRAELLAAEDLDDPRQMFEQELLDFLEEVDQDEDGAFALADLPSPERSEFEEEFHRLDSNADGLVIKRELLALLDEELREAVFEVEGHTAIMRGVIGASTPGRVLELILEHPDVGTITMLDVPGSMDDVSNVRAAQFVRRMGLATHIPRDGEVASGGTDFFLAGISRTADKGARFGVHSWSGAGEEGGDLPRNDPEHEMYLDYYRGMNIPTEFYWYTLEAAPADGIHWMTPEELTRYGVLTGNTVDMSNGNGSVLGTDESYGLDSIEVLSSGRGVVPLPETVHSYLRKTFDRYARVVTPSGRPIHILAQPSWSEDQIVHVRKVLEHLLTNAPGTAYGADKSPVADAMAERRATMCLFTDIDAMETAFDGALGDLELAIQDLRANECTPPGSPDYLKHGTRDATYEEVLHLVHDYGFRPALPEYDALLQKANAAAAAAGLWDAWPEDEPDSHRNEYIAAVYDNYLDLWTVAPTIYEGEVLEPDDVPTGTSHFGAYRAGSRAKLSELDPEGLALAKMFFPPALTFTAELPIDFKGTFHINRLPELRYTAKSQHLRHVRLRGEHNASLVGNDYANTLSGNDGDNVLQGSGGDDRLRGGGGNDVAVFRGARKEYDLRTEAGQTYVVDTVPERDGSDQLRDVERLRFSDMTELVTDVQPASEDR